MRNSNSGSSDFGPLNQKNSNEVTSTYPLDFSNGSVVNLVNSVIHQAIESAASDIHIEPYEKEVRVRYRLDGFLHRIAGFPVQQRDSIISRVKILANLDIAEKRRPQDGRIRIERSQNPIDLRVSTLPTAFGEKVVLRILDKSDLKLDLGNLGFDSRSLDLFRRSITNPYGMILVTGPTGSGKTTTLYSALNEINSEETNITTIEDPIEYNLEGINQTQVHKEIGVTFSHALRSILRQDPNIIMVGEIRDPETANIAIRSALTGHLVLSTLHTNDAPSAIARLLDMGVEPFLVASSVRFVMAQRLVRKVCRNCEQSFQPDDSVLEDLKLNTGRAFVRGEGCDLCNGTGFKGRTALIEAMPIDEKLADLINQQSNMNEIKNQAKQNGMKTLREAGIEKIKEMITTPFEVIRETYN